MKNKIILLLLIFTSVAVFLLSKQETPTSTPVIQKLQADADQPKLEKQKPTSVREIMSNAAFNDYTSPEIVEFESYGVTFRMPRYYINDLFYLKQDYTFGFIFYTLYPNFIGAHTQELRDKYFDTNNWKTSFNQIFIFWHPTPPPREERDPNILWLADIKTKPNQKWKYDLYEFTGIWKNAYYYKIPDKNEIIYISCVIDDYDDNDSYCNSYYKISENLMIMYKYHKALLPEWKKIHEGVTKLVNSFVVKK